MNSSFEYLSEKQVATFHEEGFLLIPDFLTDEQVAQYKKGCQMRLLGDTACHEIFDHITLSEEMGKIMRDLMGTQEVLYPGLSFSRTNDFPNRFGSRSFHTDAAFEPGNFNEFYPILNTGFYLQDYRKHSGGLKLIPKSHRRECITIRTVFEGIKKALSFLVRGNFTQARNTFDFSPSVNIENSPRDLIIWSTRTHHAGYAVRLKLFPKISIHPVFENWIPTFLTKPTPPERDVILTIYGAPGEIFEKYLAIQVRKAHRKDFFLASTLGTPALQKIATRAGITIRDDGHVYASDPQSTFSKRTEKRYPSGAQ